MDNIPENIKSKIGAGLLEKEGPLKLLKDELEVFFSLNRQFVLYNQKDPKVTTTANFDDLLIPEDHVSRSEKDTYYVDENTVLRTHTSAHQSTLLKEGYKKFLAFGDCYRRDTIDATHYPVFHQVEGAHIKMRSDFRNVQENGTPNMGKNAAEQDLKETLEDLMKYLFRDEGLQCRWVDAYFPFTEPSFELEIFYRDKWLEVLGCGLIHDKILENNELQQFCGWAFGIGLERIAMIRFQIPDIRLFWTEDERFTSQFKDKSWFDDFVFESYSKHPPCLKDISFWVEEFNENDFMEIVRNAGGDLIEEVKLFDSFEKDGKQSLAYRITYRSMDRSLTNEEINEIQEKIRSETSKMGVELR